MSGAPGKRVVLLHDPDFDPQDGPYMEFRLTYAGPLRATQRDPIGGQVDKRAGHKHDIRRVFHRQLKRLWQITSFLTAHDPLPGQSVGPIKRTDRFESYSIEEIARRHYHYGFNFVPLVTEDLQLICGLDILFLRPDRPGDVIWAGDIDNRLKTLFDALRIPAANEEYHAWKPGEDENPFFCLLEDDKLITKVSVETDQLLDLQDGQTAEVAHLVITVRLRPQEVAWGNIQFG